MPPVVISPEQTGPAFRGGKVSQRRTVLAVLGAAFLAVGLVDLALLWIPPRFESLSWEFATIGRTLDGLPMAVLGLGLLAYGTGRSRRSGQRARSLAAVFAVAAALVIGLGVLFATAAPAVLKEAPPESVLGVQRALVRHGAQAVTYPIALAVCAVLLWRTGRSEA